MFPSSQGLLRLLLLLCQLHEKVRLAVLCPPCGQLASRHAHTPEKFRCRCYCQRPPQNIHLGEYDPACRGTAGHVVATVYNLYPYGGASLAGIGCQFAILDFRASVVQTPPHCFLFFELAGLLLLRLLTRSSFALQTQSSTTCRLGQNVLTSLKGHMRACPNIKLR
jgi:hypothetical protein